jgi:hypothetical protein
VLTSAQLDTLIDPITTFVNTTKLDTVNVNIQDVVDGLSSSEAGIILSQAGVGGVTESSVSGVSLTTTFATVTSVIAPTTGDYLVLVNGIMSSRETSTVGSTVWAGYIYTRLRNTTTTTAIGPDDILIGQGVTDAAVSLSDLQTRRVDQHFSYAYITTLAASNVVAVQCYRDSSYGVGASTVDIHLSILRLIQ